MSLSWPRRTRSMLGNRSAPAALAWEWMREVGHMRRQPTLAQCRISASWPTLCSVPWTCFPSASRGSAAWRRRGALRGCAAFSTPRGLCAVRAASHTAPPAWQAVRMLCQPALQCRPHRLLRRRHQRRLHTAPAMPCRRLNRAGWAATLSSTLCCPCCRAWLGLWQVSSAPVLRTAVGMAGRAARRCLCENSVALAS